MDPRVSTTTPSIMAQGNTCPDALTNASPISLGGGTSSGRITSKTLQKLRGAFAGHHHKHNPGSETSLSPQQEQVHKKRKVEQGTSFSPEEETHANHSRPRGGGGIRRRLKEETIDEETDLEASEDQKDSGVDPGDHIFIVSETSSSVPFKGRRKLSSIKSNNSSSKGGGTHQRYVLEIDQDLISAGFPSDLPSELIDIEGNFIGEFDFRFGIEEDEFDSEDFEDPFTSENSRCSENSSKSGGRDLKKVGSNPSWEKMSKSNGNVGNYCNNSSTAQDENQEEQVEEVEQEGISSPVKVQSPRTFVHRRRSRSPHTPLDRHYSSGATSNNSSTITQHYYPESGWGFVVLVTATSCQTFLCGMQLSFGILMRPIFNKFGEEFVSSSGWLGALSLGISLFLSPVWVSICKKKSTRLSAVFGGLVASLGCLFTSFASQFHQLFVSYGAFIGIGVGLTRDASTLMVGQYFKRRREMVEIFVVAGSGLGIVLMSVSIHASISSLGWRLGLQVITGTLFLTFFLSTCYRSASLYHPQRRAILHLKNQKRKVKEKEKREEKPPFIDYSCLRSKTLQILLLSSAFISFGIYNPLFSLGVECTKKGFEECSLVFLHVYVGTAWILGSFFFGLLVIQKSQECRVSKQYLTQVASVICGISMLAFTSVKGNSGMVIFSWVYGFSLGGYNYALKVYTYERVRARHFPRAWSFVQAIQAFPLLFGVSLNAQINQTVGWNYGYLLSAISIFIGAACLFLADVRRRRMSRRKAHSANSSMKTCETTDGTQSPKSKRLSFSYPVEQPQPQSKQNNDSDEEGDPGRGAETSEVLKELTCISEEGIADMIYFDEWAEYFGECITSCNKVENCLASEYDPVYAGLVEKRARRWSAARHGNALTNLAGGRKSKKTKASVLLNPKLFQLSLGNRSQQKLVPPSNIQQPECSGNCRKNLQKGQSTAASAVGVVRVMPFLQSHIKSRSLNDNESSEDCGTEGEQSFRAIDEESSV